MTPEEIILTANPIFKGELETPYGNILFGRMWQYHEADLFAKECETKGIDIIWNLLEKSHGDIGNAKEIWSPIDDFGAPSNTEDFINTVNLIVAALLAGNKIFVHCHGGKGRTSLALASLLVSLGLRATAALLRVHESAHGPETQAQKDFVLHYEKTLVSKIKIIP